MITEFHSLLDNGCFRHNRIFDSTKGFTDKLKNCVKSVKSARKCQQICYNSEQENSKLPCVSFFYIKKFGRRRCCRQYGSSPPKRFTGKKFQGVTSGTPFCEGKSWCIVYSNDQINICIKVLLTQKHRTLRIVSGSNGEKLSIMRLSLFYVILIRKTRCNTKLWSIVFQKLEKVDKT